MSNEKLINERIRKITERILEDYKNGRDIDKMDVFSQPDSDAVTDIVNKLLNILFPGYYREKNYRSYNDNSRISILIEDVVYNLAKQIAIALRFREEYAQSEESEIRDMSEDSLMDLKPNPPFDPMARRCTFVTDCARDGCPIWTISPASMACWNRA